MKHIILFLRTSCFVMWTGCASTTDFFANQFFLPNEGVRKPIYSVQTERGIGFITTDNIQLLSDIHRPKKLEKTPTILVRIPFTNTFKNRSRSDVIGRYWARRGYTVVIQGTRGRYESGGEFYPLAHEREDGIQTLHWITEQSWYDGRIAMWGGSAFGHTQWAIADQVDPGPEALFVQIASTNFRDMFYPGNAFSLESALYWAIRSRGNRDREVVSIKDIEKGVNGFPVIEADDRATGDTNFFNDWLINKDNKDYWQQIDGENRTHTIKSPILLMAGWFDPFLPTQLNDFNSILNNAKKSVTKNTRLIVGPWAHARDILLPGAQNSIPYRRESIAPSIAWFDHQLGISKIPLKMSRIKIFVMGDNSWREENEWPLARTKYTNFYLHSMGAANSHNGDGLLKNVIQKKGTFFDEYIYDPLDPVPSAGGAMLGPRSGIQLQNTVESRDDVLVYTTDALTKPLEATGPVSTILYVSTDVPSTDFTAKLVDVYPDGQAYNVCDGILRRDYSKKNNHENNPVEIKIDLWPTSYVFDKGHKIRLEISSSNFPRYDRNTNTGESTPTANTTIIANQKIFHSTNYQSRLILPIIPRSK